MAPEDAPRRDHARPPPCPRRAAETPLALGRAVRRNGLHHAPIPCQGELGGRRDTRTRRAHPNLSPLQRRGAARQFGGKMFKARA